ncbi:MAG: alpha-2-macroglobulin, partial [Flavobacterium sp.]
LQISNKDGEKEMAEMVATLYDASSDDFRRLSWDTYLKTTYNYTNYTWKAYEQLNYGNILWFLRTNVNYGIKVRQYENLNLFGYNYYGSYNYGYRNYIERIKNKPKKGISPEAANELAKLAKGKTVHGIVLDNYGYAIPGVSVKSGSINTTSNKFGVYSIDVKTGAEVTFAYLGYQIVKLKVRANKRIDTKLFPDENTLNEVVVTGYGAPMKKQSITGAVSSVQAQEIKIRGTNSLPAKQAGLKTEAVVVEDNTVYNFMSMESYDPKTGIEMVNGKPIYRKSTIIPRTNFNETAFFYPQLKTNEKGEINIEFTIPQSLTRYKMMGFAHTKDLKTATISNEVITQKQLAISANAPRFFREGDTILFSAKLNNLSGKTLKGDTYLELKNALTGKIIQILADGEQLNQNFELANEGNSVLKWKLIIPTGINAITYKLLAQSGKFSDGEEMTIPVLPNAMLVTESMPINVRANTAKMFTMDKLLKSGSSTTLRHQALTFEFTSNPVWYAIQALPYLMEYPYECAEQTFSRFYANSFATGIINSSPKIAAIFKQWQSTNNVEALLSNLEKNPELKSILLEETPWVRNADNETERKKRLATLFDLNRMTYELKDNFEQLEKMQYADGSFPWFSGMEGNRYITQHIVLGICQLKKLKLVDEKAYPNLNVMLNKAIIYLDNQLVKDYKAELNGKRFGYLPLHYLFARSYTNQINNNADFIKAKNFYLKKITANWKTFDSYQLAQTALVLNRNGSKIEPTKIITLLRQTAQQSDEMGMYWAKNTNGWWWYQSPIETQALLIEAFDEVAADTKAVEEMKIWLLKNKQTNDWKTTKATAAACYALLMKGYDILSENKEPEIKIGNQTLADLGFADSPKEAGTGYQKININGADIKPEMAKIEIKNNNQSIAWGALYWQYFEQLDKITPANTGVKIKKQLFIQNTTIKGNLLTPLIPTNVLKPGDLLKVRIEIYSDRDMEYVHLKDMRSSSFEPVNVISRYKYQDGLGYYESTKDASTNFFISYLRKGTYVFEYELRVTHSGNFSNGITTLQCMYAPELSTHSEGVRVMVK